MKKLFVRDQFANYYEVTPLCVLDFYIYETEQRGGQGKVKFKNSSKYVGDIRLHAKFRKHKC